jgi:hypothetical protein
MSWRLIAFIIIFAVFMAFTMLNIENRCDITFGFSKFTEVPVFFTVFISFFLGFISAVPFILNFNKKSKITGKDCKQVETSSGGINPVSARERFLSRKHLNSSSNGGSNDY